MNNTAIGCRYIVNQKAPIQNSASRLFSSLPANWRCSFTTRSNFDIGHVNFLCKNCLKLSEKREGILSNLQEVDEKIQGLSRKRSSETHLASPSKFIAYSNDENECENNLQPIAHSTPSKVVRPAVNALISKAATCSSNVKKSHSISKCNAKVSFLLFPILCA